MISLIHTMINICLLFRMNTNEENVKVEDIKDEKEEMKSDEVIDNKSNEKMKKKMRIAVAGCVHGEIDKVYSTMAEIEKDGNGKFDLLLCCGDFQATRNYGDLHHMHVPEKYRSLETFYMYYSGAKKAPVLTIFIGGNHEASGYMAELPHGGWVAPNIYFMGHSNVVDFAGLRIGGMTGIYKANDYHKGRYECPPFEDRGSIVSAYHVRSLDVFRCKQLSPIDIFLSHDWPTGIWDYGDVEWLLQKKPYFTDEVRSGVMGNPGAREILTRVRPHYWFAAHMHVGFAALVPHEKKEGGEKGRETRFLSLDKPLPRRHFLQSVDMYVDEDADMSLSYDEEWLAILKNTDHLVSTNNEKVYLPSAANKSERYDFRPTKEELEGIRSLGSDFHIPLNFVQTSPPLNEITEEAKRAPPSYYYRNPQSETFARWMGIKDINSILASTCPCVATPYCEIEETRKGMSSIQQNTEDFGNADFIIDTVRDEEEEKDDEDIADIDVPTNNGLDDWTPPTIKNDEDKTKDGNNELVLKRRKVDYNEDE